MAGLSEKTVEKVKRGTRSWARSKGIDPESERGRAITFGTLRKMGWRRSSETRKKQGIRDAIKTLRRTAS